MRDEEHVLTVPEYRESIRNEIKRVLKRHDSIRNAHAEDDGMQRVVLSLPKEIVYLARFLAILEKEEMPASLRLWQYAEEDGKDVPALQRHLNSAMRRYLEDEVTIRMNVALATLNADVKPGVK
ncbi:hypothetical protein [Aquibaculum sediminis]|uniref:hypothetical protein n=1 Tax=Aquibaculum sediminis TaxID=3231907 RepID=UPI003452DE0F